MEKCVLIKYLNQWKINLCNLTLSDFSLIQREISTNSDIKDKSNIQGVLDHPYTPFLSKIKHFREKRFRQKLYGFEGAIRWYHWFDLEVSFEGHVKVTSIFLNGTPYIFLQILVAYLDNFPKHYN